MSYLQDRKQKRKRTFLIVTFVLFLFVLFYFRSPISSGFSYVAHSIFKPVLKGGNSIGSKFSSMTAYFITKASLEQENESLELRLREQEALLSNYNTVLSENNSLKETLGRMGERRDLVVGAILSKPNRSPYDTLIIDIGENQNIETGDLVFALGNVPVGRIGEVYRSTSKVVLFSTSKEKTEVIISGQNAFAEIVGRGGGNFEMTLPRDFVVGEGVEVVLPGITPYIVAKVKTVISDPRDSFSKALLVSPVNIFELKFVEVRK
jgi:cell shape-determining protein MreC